MTADAMIKRTCMRDHIRDMLVARILDGSYPAGTQLKELALARELGVSQAPIREALRELEGSGLVTSERFRGTRVRGADPREMRESYDLRSVIEQRAVELAAPFPAELTEALERHIRSMSRAAREADAERYIDAALSFHRRLIEASGNRTFLTIWDSLYWHVRGRIAMRQFTRKGRGLKPIVERHKALCMRLRAQDVPAAAREVRAIFDLVSAAFDAK